MVTIYSYPVAPEKLIRYCGHPQIKKLFPVDRPTGTFFPIKSGGLFFFVVFHRIFFPDNFWKGTDFSHFLFSIYGLRICLLDTLNRWLYFRKTGTPPHQKREQINLGKQKNPTSRLAYLFSTRWTGNAFLLKGGLKRPFDGGLKLHNTSLWPRVLTGEEGKTTWKQPTWSWWVLPKHEFSHWCITHMNLNCDVHTRQSYFGYYPSYNWWQPITLPPYNSNTLSRILKGYWLKIERHLMDAK